MAFSIASEIDDAATRRLDEVSHATCGHRLADEIGMGVLVLLTLANGSCFTMPKLLMIRALAEPVAHA